MASAPYCVLPPSGGSAGTCGTCIPSGSATVCTGSGQGNCCGGLVCSGGVCSAPPPPPASTLPVCGSSQFNDVFWLSGIAGLGMASLVALFFMLGHFFSNARMLDWAKTEALQVFVSLLVVGVLLFAVSTFCTLQVGELRSMTGSRLPLIFKGNEVRNFYEGAVMYLENLGGIALANMATIRYNIGAYEIRTSYQEFVCDGMCLYSLASQNVAKFGGETMYLAISNSLLGTATVSYLTAVFQYFTLQYIYNGLFLIFLPIAIVIRSIPFMRNMGGALIAIFVALYIMYPLMIVADAYIAPALASGNPPMLTLRTQGALCPQNGGHIGAEVFGLANPDTLYIQCQTDTENEQNLGNHGIHESDMQNIDPGQFAMSDSIRLNVLIFLTAVFLPAMNFIAIAAVARDLSHFLGEEADISKLGQMV